MDIDDSINKHFKIRRSPLQEVISPQTQTHYSLAQNLKLDTISTTSPFSKLSATHTRNSNGSFFDKSKSFSGNLPGRQSTANTTPSSCFTFGYGPAGLNKNRHFEDNYSLRHNTKKEPEYHSASLYSSQTLRPGGCDDLRSLRLNSMVDELAVRHEQTPEDKLQGQEVAVLEQSHGSLSSKMDMKSDAAEDLSTLMFKGATDLRNAKSALEEQTKLAQNLRENLSKITAEKEDLEKKLVTFKEKTSKNIDCLSNNLIAMNDTLEALRSQTQSYRKVTEETKISASNLGNYRMVIKESTNRMEMMIGEDGLFMPTVAWKNTLNDIRSDLVGKQRDIDRFHERLEYTQSELAESKSRVVELETAQLLFSKDLKSGANKLHDTGESLNKLSQLLRLQQQQNTDILTINMDLERKLTHDAEKMSLLNSQLMQFESEHEELANLRNELEKSRALLIDRDEKVQILQVTKERISSVEASLRSKDSHIDTLKDSCFKSSELLENANKRLYSTEAQLALQVEVVTNLEKNLSESRLQLQSELELRSQILDEKDVLAKEKESLLKVKLDQTMEIERLRTRHSLAEAKIEMLQGRLEEQASMTHLGRKAYDDIQERLLSSEAKNSEKLEDIRHFTGMQTTTLKDLVTSLGCTFEEQEKETRRRIEEHANTSLLSSSKNFEHIREMENSITQKLDENILMQKGLASLSEENRTLYAQLQSHQEELKSLRERFSASQAIFKTHAEEVIQLKNQLENHQKIEQSLNQRAKNIVSRYTEGDLSSEEKQLIEAVIKASQLNFEQQLIAKTNEIRQRDNIIKSLNKTKSDLEGQLTSRLNQLKSRAGQDGLRSLINPDSWGYPQISSSEEKANTDNLRNYFATTGGTEGSLIGNDTALRASGHFEDTLLVANEDTPRASSFNSIENHIDETDGSFSSSYENPGKRKSRLDQDDLSTRRVRITRSMQKQMNKPGDNDTTISTKQSEVEPKVKARRRR